MRGGLSTLRPGPLTPEKETRYPLYGRLGEPQGQSGQVRKTLPSPGFDLRTFQPVASRYTDWAIHNIKTEKHIRHTVTQRWLIWWSYLSQKLLSKHIIEGKIAWGIDVRRRQGRRRKRLLDLLKETRGYWKSKGEALDRTLWRNRFGWINWPVVRQITERVRSMTGQNTELCGRAAYKPD